MIDDPRHECLVFFFRVLRIEDAMLMLLHAGATEEMFAIETVAAVKRFLRIPNEIACDAMIIFLQIGAVVLQLAVIEVIGIHAVVVILPNSRVAAPLRILLHENMMTVFAIEQSVPCDIFTTQHIQCLMGLAQSQLLKYVESRWYVLQEHRALQVIGLFLVLFIEDAILLTVHVDTSEAIVTTDAVAAQRKVGTVMAVIAEQAPVQLIRSRTFVTEFAVV